MYITLRFPQFLFHPLIIPVIFLSKTHKALVCSKEILSRRTVTNIKLLCFFGLYSSESTTQRIHNRNPSPPPRLEKRWFNLKKRNKAQRGTKTIRCWGSCSQSSLLRGGIETQRDLGIKNGRMYTPPCLTALSIGKPPSAPSHYGIDKWDIHDSMEISERWLGTAHV